MAVCTKQVCSLSGIYDFYLTVLQKMFLHLHPVLHNGLVF